MTFDLEKNLAVLERTPAVLERLLHALPDDWTMHDEGTDTWNAFDVLGHLIHGEKTDWMPRVHIILEKSGNKRFVPFERFAHLEANKGKSLSGLLDEFKDLRKRNLASLRSLSLSQSDLEQTGIHPDFGTVNLRQLLATWVVHDLDHLVQISRVMAYQLKEEVGPWKEYLRIVKGR